MGTKGVYTLPPYPGWSNQQITKNCGLLLYLLQKNHGFHAVMAGAKVSAAYPQAKYVPGMVIDFLPDGTQDTRLRYIEGHGHDMDLFVLHGAWWPYVDMVRLYRSIRPEGKIYMELDANASWCDRIPWDNEDFRYLLSECDVIGTSCRKMQRHLSRKWPFKINYLPNGFYNYANVDMNVDFACKENIILTVGRIGTAEKQTDLLLESFAAVEGELPDWSLRLVGQVDPAFEPYMVGYYERFPNLLDRVTFTGVIEDKAALMREYKRAKIFALTSRVEGGTPNVVAEALSGGDYIVTSAIDAAADATDGGRCGSVFDAFDKAALAKLLLEVCRSPEGILAGGKRAVAYAEENFDFERIAARLYYLLYAQ